MDRREFAALAATAPLMNDARFAIRDSRTSSFELEEKSIAELQEMMTGGRMTSRRLVDLYTRRIAELDGRKHLNHVLQLNPEARQIADDLDRERRAGQLRGPLHGIPILIKDNIATADQMETTAGSLALVGARPPRDSFLAQKL